MSAETEDLSLPEGFGAPSGGESKYERRRMKKDVTTLVERPLPAMKGLFQKREPGIYVKVHYGWNGRNPVDPTQKAFRPFLCVEEKRNGMIVQECPACKYRAEYVAKNEEIRKQEKEVADSVRAKAKKANVTDEGKIAAAISRELESIKATKMPLLDWLKDHGVDAKWKFYSLSKTNKLGIAEIPFKAKKAMDAAAKELKETIKNYPLALTKGKEMPIQVNGKIGVYFKFNRIGEGFATDYNCSVNRISDIESGSEKIDYHIISNDQLKQALEVLPCLVEDTEKMRLSIDKIQSLVDHSRSLNGGYDPDFVDSIWGKTTAVAPLDEPEDVPAVATVPAVKTSEPVPVEPKTEVKVVPAKQSEVKPEVKQESTPAVVDYANAGDDEFDKLFG